MREVFSALSQAAFSQLSSAEQLSLWLSGEESNFVRLNRGLVRQPSTVSQAFLQVSLVTRGRQARARLPMTGELAADASAVSAALCRLREVVAQVPEDPFLLVPTQAEQSEDLRTGELPEPVSTCERMTELAQGCDLVGLFSQGRMLRGLQSSLGHRHWHQSESFHFDFSVYARGDKAAKQSYSGTHFEPSELARRIDQARAASELLHEPEHRPEPGKYRAYLAPAALAELVGLIAWDSLSSRALRTKRSALVRMLDGGSRLDPRVSLVEHAAGGVAARFLPSGFSVPDRVSLVDQGRLVGELVSPRSAREYGVEVNSTDAERPTSLELAGGELAESDVLDALGTGLYVTNLWYTNFSDPLSCRITGMTRFATTWVRRGKPVAPLSVMRFDDSLYRILGDQLESLTREREWLFDGGTYGERSTDSYRLPGALLRELTLTL